MNGTDLLRLASSKYPDQRWALNRAGTVLARWSPELGRFQGIAVATITGPWVQMDFEVKVNGKLPYVDADFELPEETEWQQAFDVLRSAGLEADADNPIAIRYRAASDAVNHANRSREFAGMKEATK